MTERKRAPKTNYANELITHNGRTLSLRAWADEVGIDYRTFSLRYARGLRDAQLFQPLNNYNLTLTVDGKTHTLSEWSQITGIPKEVIKMRAVRGWTDERIFGPYHKNAPRRNKPKANSVDLRQRLRDLIAS